MFLPRSYTTGEIRIEDGTLGLFDYLSEDPNEAIVSCPVREVSVLRVRRYFGYGVALDLGGVGKWYLRPPSQGPKAGRRGTQSLIEAIAEAKASA